MSAKDAWQTIEYDTAGNVVGVRAGRTELDASHRPKCYYGMNGRKARSPRSVYLQKQQEANERPMWMETKPTWVRKAIRGKIRAKAERVFAERVMACELAAYDA